MRAGTGQPRAERVAVSPGVALHVERWDGEPGATAFVLVHGLASNAHLWSGVAEHLAARGHPVLTLDQRGHGESDAPDVGATRTRSASHFADAQSMMPTCGLTRRV